MKDKIVIVRKDHKCDSCENVIHKGDKARYQEHRFPIMACLHDTYDPQDRVDEQVGIEYKKFYSCQDCIDAEAKYQAECDELSKWFNEEYYAPSPRQ